MSPPAEPDGGWSPERSIDDASASRAPAPGGA